MFEVNKMSHLSLAKQCLESDCLWIFHPYKFFVSTNTPSIFNFLKLCLNFDWKNKFYFYILALKLYVLIVEKFVDEIFLLWLIVFIFLFLKLFQVSNLKLYFLYLWFLKVLKLKCKKKKKFVVSKSKWKNCYRTIKSNA